MQQNTLNIETVLETMAQYKSSALSLAERFIEAIRPYKLTDEQAMYLFQQIKKAVQTVVQRPVDSTDSWLLLPG